MLNELSPNTMSNTVDKYNYVFIVSKPYPCHPYMSITEIFFW